MEEYPIEKCLREILAQEGRVWVHWRSIPVQSGWEVSIRVAGMGPIYGNIWDAYKEDGEEGSSHYQFLSGWIVILRDLLPQRYGFLSPEEAAKLPRSS